MGKHSSQGTTNSEQTGPAGQQQVHFSLASVKGGKQTSGLGFLGTLLRQAPGQKLPVTQSGPSDLAKFR